MYEDRILNEDLRKKVVSVEEAGALIKSGMTFATSGFAAGYPKAIPGALAAQIKAAHERGEPLNGVRETPDMETVAAQRLGQHIHMPHGAPVRRLDAAPRRAG